MSEMTDKDIHAFIGRVWTTHILHPKRPRHLPFAEADIIGIEGDLWLMTHAAVKDKLSDQIDQKPA